jgi:hypothetical protein
MTAVTKMRTDEVALQAGSSYGAEILGGRSACHSRDAVLEADRLLSYRERIFIAARQLLVTRSRPWPCGQ